MKRTVVALTMLLTLIFVPMAKAERLTAHEAKVETVTTAWKTKGMPDKIESLKCERKSAKAFRCRLKMRVETRWTLKDCAFVTDVVKETRIRTSIRDRRCKDSDAPFLSRGHAHRAMNRSADPRYRSKENSSWGGSYSRVSRTKYLFEISWSNDREICIQSIKVGLVDGKPKANASEAACSANTPWPASAGPGTRRSDIDWTGSWGSVG